MRVFLHFAQWWFCRFEFRTISHSANDWQHHLIWVDVQTLKQQRYMPITHRSRVSSPGSFPLHPNTPLAYDEILPCSLCHETDHLFQGHLLLISVVFFCWSQAAGSRLRTTLMANRNLFGSCSCPVTAPYNHFMEINNLFSGLKESFLNPADWGMNRYSSVPR